MVNWLDAGEPFARLSRGVPELKGDIVGSFSLRRVAVRPIAEQAELPRYDFGPIALARSVI